MKVDRILSPKQWKIMDVIIRANPDGTWVDLDELLERLDYKPSKESMQFSIRALVNRGLIEKKATEFRRGAQRRVYAPTSLGYTECRR